MANEYASVNLGQGFPSFPTPEFCVDCVVEAVRRGDNQYTRPGGNPFLVEVISEFYGPLMPGQTINPMRNVAVCSGAQEGIYNILATFCDEGDQMLCIEPFFDAYRKAADLVGVETVGVPLRLEAYKQDGAPQSAAAFKLDIEELEAAITPRTKLLIINTPHNPTGKVFSRAELEAVAEVVRRHPRLIVLSDEVYEFMTFDGLSHERFALLPDMWDRTISLFSAGKTFSATGWRVGYYIGPADLMEPLMETQGIVAFCAPTPLQVAVGHAFRKGAEQGYFAELAASLQRKRDRLCAALEGAGLDPVVSQGGYFVLADTGSIPVPPQARRDVAVNKWLTQNRGVTGIPTSYFYSPGNEHLADNVLRFAYCKTDAELDAAAASLARRA